MKIIVRKPTEKEMEQAASWATWSKAPSSFEWSYDEQETCYILDGVAMVMAKDGTQARFTKGDWVIFPKGLECTWIIEKEIQKKYKFGA